MSGSASVDDPGNPVELGAAGFLSIGGRRTKDCLARAVRRRVTARPALFVRTCADLNVPSLPNPPPTRVRQAPAR
jgi:hypothetical protein